MDRLLLPADLGDPFCLTDLSLPRPAEGYGVQHLGRDWLLDRDAGEFRAIRDPELRGLFADFASAAAAAHAWLAHQPAAPLAIVPVAWDAVSERHVLIFGVLPAELPATTLALAGIAAA
jgi:hypothetical protein